MRQHHKRTILTTFRYIKYTNLKKEIRGYGYSYSFKKYLASLRLSFLGILLAGKFFHLQIPYIIVPDPGL